MFLVLKALGVVVCVRLLCMGVLFLVVLRAGLVCLGF